MKAIRYNISALLLSFAIMISGCSKSTDDPMNTANTNQTTTTTTPSFSDGYGSLAAVSTISYTSVGGVLFPMTVNSAVAAFYTSAGSGSMTDGGNVTLNGKALTKQGNNSYVYQNFTDPLDFSGNTAWNVSGSATVPSFSYSDDKGMPSYSDYSSLPSGITRSAGLTIDLSGKISGADSVYVVLISGSGNIIRHLGPNPGQCVFTAAELGTLAATTTGIVEVCPWNYKSEDFSSKKFYFVNESAYVKSGIPIN